MKQTKIINHEGHKYKVTVDVQKITEATVNPSQTISVKIAGKNIKVPVNNDTDGALSDGEVKTIITKALPEAMKNIREFIRSSWDEWMDGEFSEKLMDEIIADVFDLVNITQFSNSKISIEYILNNKYTSHKYSRGFFGMHTLVAYGIYENGKYNFKYCSLEG